MVIEATIVENRSENRKRGRHYNNISRDSIITGSAEGVGQKAEEYRDNRDRNRAVGGQWALLDGQHNTGDQGNWHGKSQYSRQKLCLAALDGILQPI